MIGAMPAVAVRHERRRQEKRLKRPSQLYLGGQWMPPAQGSPPTPSPHGPNSHLEPLPELYLCGKISGLHAVVVCLLLGAVVLVVGLVQLAPGATTTDHRLALLVAGATLLLLGIILAAVRCYVLHCVPLPPDSPVATPLPPPTSDHHHQAMVSRGTLDLLVGHQNQPETDALMHTDNQQEQLQQSQQQLPQHHHHHHHHHQHHVFLKQPPAALATIRPFSGVEGHETRTTPRYLDNFLRFPFLDGWRSCRMRPHNVAQSTLRLSQHLLVRSRYLHRSKLENEHKGFQHHRKQIDDASVI